MLGDLFASLHQVVDLVWCAQIDEGIDEPGRPPICSTVRGKLRFLECPASPKPITSGLDPLEALVRT